MVSQPVSPVSPVGSRRSWASSLRHEPTNQHNDHAARTGDAPPIPPQETLTPDPQSHAAASPRPPSHETSPHPVDADFPVRSSASSAQYHPQDAERLKLWTPFFLRRRVLLSFITLFILLIIVLAILFGLSSRDERLASADSQLYYLWVYGPTAGTPYPTLLREQTNIACSLYHYRRILGSNRVSLKADDSLGLDGPRAAICAEEFVARLH